MNHTEGLLEKMTNKDFYDENDLRKMGFKSVGIDVRVSKTAIIKHPENVTIGNHVAIDNYVVITTKATIGNYIHIASGTIIFGGSKSLLIMEDYTFISANCTIICGSDDYSGDCLIGPTIPIEYRKVTYGTIFLQKYSGVGASSTVMPNITIGEGAVTGAGAVVTKNLDAWGIYVGVPAKFIKQRKKEIILQFADEIEKQRQIEDFVVVVSVTDEECYKMRLEKSLTKIGIKYSLIFADSSLTLSKAYNSILKYKYLNKSKYIMFVGQDVEFLDENWGKKIIGYCDQLPLMGYAGVEARDHSNKQINYFTYPETQTTNPVEVETCDGAIAIIPTKLFLERQFDEDFPWFPVMEDYALWVSKVKNLKVYSLPLKIFNGYAGHASKWVKQFTSNTDYVSSLRKDYNRLLKKWNLPKVNTTTWA